MNRRESVPHITSENFEMESSRLSNLVWGGNYAEALPLADGVLKFRTEHGDREPALIQYASNYYSAASRVWRERGMKAALEVGRLMNTALRALQERVEQEIEKQGGRKDGMIPVSLDGLSSSQLDVMQSVYRRAGEMSDRLPLVRPLRQLLLSKEKDPVRDFDVAALLAIRAGLKKVRAEKKDEQKVAPESELFLETGSFEIARRYGWEETADARAKKIFELAQTYPWPPEEVSSETAFEEISKYGQAARVARHVRDVARQAGDEARAQEFAAKAENYAVYVPDQKAKL
jgi:hypothetical protein